MNRLRQIDYFRVLKVIFIAVILTMSLSACGEQSFDETAGDKSSCEAQWNAKADCWQSKLFTLIYNAAGEMAVNLYEKVSKGAFGFIMVAFALWFAVQCLKIFNKSLSQSAAEFWNTVFRQLFVCVACGIIVSSLDNIIWALNNLVMPIFIACIDFANEVLSVGVSQSGENYGACFVAGGEDMSGAGFPEGPRTALECIICRIHEKLVMGKAIGIRMLTLDVPITGRLIGILYLFIFLAIDLVFVFYLVDNTVRFGLILAMFPLWVMAFAFKITKGYTSQAFTYILNCGANLVFICILMTLVINTIQAFVTDQYPVLSPAGCTVDDSLDDVKEFARPGVAFLTSLFLCFFLMSAIEFATKTADSMVGGGIKGGAAQKLKALGQALVALAITGGSALALKSGLTQKAMKAKDKLANTKAGQMAGKAKRFFQGADKQKASGGDDE